MYTFRRKIIPDSHSDELSASTKPSDKLKQHLMMAKSIFFHKDKEIDVKQEQIVETETEIENEVINNTME